MMSGLALTASQTPAGGAAPVETLAWSTLSPPASPPPLTGATSVYDSDNRTVVLFGGMKANGALSNDTWVWNGSTWTDFPASEIQAPPARQLASMAFDPKLHQLILFGGEGAGGTPLGDMWAWNGASWYQQSDLDSSAWPSPREAATLAYDASGALMLFGGTGQTSPSPPPTTTTTSPTTTTTLPAAPPAPATGAAGSSAPAPTPVLLSDTWQWNGSSWIQSHAAGPPARSGSAAAYDAATGQTLLFGGESTPTNTAKPQLLSDTWAWTGSLWTRWVPGAKATAWPAAREGGVMTVDPLGRGLVLFGGTTNSGAVGDSWLWDGNSWQLEPTIGAVTARSGAAAAFDAAGRQGVFFGGTDRNGALLGDTVALAGHAPVVIGPATTVPSSGAHVPARSHSPGRSARTPSARPPTTVTTPTIPPGPPPAVSAPASPTVLHPGDLVRLVGSGFKPGAVVTITFHSLPTVVGKSKADSSGTFTATVAVPASAVAGTHHFEATGPGRQGPLAELLATVEIEAIPGLGHATTTAEKVTLVAAALAIPVATWLALAGAGWWRRRPRLPST